MWHATGLAVSLPAGSQPPAHPGHSTGQERKPHIVGRVLPSLMTLGSLACGLYAILLCVGPTPAVDRAAWIIFAGMILDMLDGRLARLMGTESELGRQLDSLADMVTFGTAPAALVYTWSLSALGPWGPIAPSVYVWCGAVRLARYNVRAGAPRPDEDIGSRPWNSVGLPIPPAAGVVVGAVVGWPNGLAFDYAPLLVCAGMIALGMLMASKIEYPTFKRDGVPRLTTTAAVAAAVSAMVGAAGGRTRAAILVLFSIYVGLGLVKAGLRSVKGRTLVERA